MKKKTRRLLSMFLAVVMLATSLACGTIAFGADAKTTGEISALLGEAKILVYGASGATPGVSAVVPGAGAPQPVTFDNRNSSGTLQGGDECTVTYSQDKIYYGDDAPSSVNVTATYKTSLAVSGSTYRASFGSAVGGSALNGSAFTSVTGTKFSAFANMTSDKEGSLSNQSGVDISGFSSISINGLLLFDQGSTRETSEVLTFTKLSGLATTGTDAVFARTPYYFFNRRMNGAGVTANWGADSNGTGKNSTAITMNPVGINFIVYDKTELRNTAALYTETLLKNWLDCASELVASGNTEVAQDVENYNQALKMVNQLLQSSVNQVTQTQLDAAQLALKETALKIMACEVPEVAYEGLISISAPAMASVATGTANLEKSFNVTLTNNSNKTAIITNFVCSDSVLTRSSNESSFTLSAGQSKTITYSGTAASGAGNKVTYNFNYTFEGFTQVFTSVTRTVLIIQRLPADEFSREKSSTTRVYNVESSDMEGVKINFFPKVGYLEVGEEMSAINTQVHFFGTYNNDRARTIKYWFYGLPYTEVGFKNVSSSPRNNIITTDNSGRSVVTTVDYPSVNNFTTSFSTSTGRSGGGFVDFTGTAPTGTGACTINWGGGSTDKWDVQYFQGNSKQKGLISGEMAIGAIGEDISYGELGDTAASSYTTPTQTIYVFDTTNLKAAIANANTVMGQESIYAMGATECTNAMSSLKKVATAAEVLLTTRYITFSDSSHPEIANAFANAGRDEKGNTLLSTAAAGSTPQQIIDYVTTRLNTYTNAMAQYKKIDITKYAAVMTLMESVMIAKDFNEVASVPAITAPSVDTAAWGSYVNGSAVATALTNLYTFAYGGTTSTIFNKLYGTTSQTNLDALCNALEIALKGLGSLEFADFAALRAAIQEAKSISEAPYTESAYNTFLTAYAKAVETAASSSIYINFQPTIESATNALLDAIAELKLRDNLKTVTVRYRYINSLGSLIGASSLRSTAYKYGDTATIESYSIQPTSTRAGVILDAWATTDNISATPPTVNKVIATAKQFTLKSGTTNQYTYSFTCTEDIDLIPVYTSVPMNTAYATVKYYDATGYELIGQICIPLTSTDGEGVKYGVLDINKAPAIPAIPFYKNGSWDYSNVNVNKITGDIDIFAVYDEVNSEQYSLSINGIYKGSFDFDTNIRGAAVAASGNDFFCWVNKVGNDTDGYKYEIVSYEPNYKFQMYGHTDLYEVTVNNKEVYGISDDFAQTPTVRIRTAYESLDGNPAVNDVANLRLRFISQFALPEGASFNNAGIIYAYGDIEDLNFRTQGVREVVTSTSNISTGNVYMINLVFTTPPPAPSPRPFTARAFLTYTVNGEITTIYSDNAAVGYFGNTIV